MVWLTNEDFLFEFHHGLTDQSGCTHVLVDQSESREGMCGYKLTNQREGIHLHNCQWTEGELWVVEWRVSGYTCHLWLHYLFGGSEHICACCILFIDQLTGAKSHLSQDLELYKARTQEYMTMHALEASKKADGNQNLQHELHVPDPLEFWSHQVMNLSLLIDKIKTVATLF